MADWEKDKPADKVSHESPTMGPGSKAIGDEPAGFPVQNWDRYRFESFIGDGGMGRVYKAYDPVLKRHVALKFIRGDDPQLKQRFLREAQSQASVEHDNVCKIYDTGEVQGRLYIAMQLINGQTLNRISKDLSNEQLVTLFKNVADGIHAAHRVGLIHRDIKPGNIMVERTEDGMLHPYILDFGLVREAEAKGITMTGMVIGTPGYMAPEQAWGDAHHPVDRRADVYSLGATMYEILSGHPPYEGKNSMELLKMLLEEDPPSLNKRIPSIPHDLETIVMKCLEREPQRRYDSARALADDLERYLDGEPIQARRSTILYRVQKKARKHKAAFATISALTILLISLLGYAIYSRIQTGRQTATAQRFGMEVEKIEGTLYKIRTLPIHNIRNELQKIRERIKPIGKQMRDIGGPAEGPGLYAIGRIHLGLHEYGKAREALERAWNKDYQQPEVAYALGLTLGFLYRNELAALEQIGNKEEREAKKKKIESEFRDPSANYLRKSAGTNFEAPEYVEAMLLFYEKKYDPALVKTRAAFQKVPWLYEAKMLEGTILSAKASNQNEAGKFREALELFHEADASYRQAVEIAKSDPQVYGGLCGVWNNALQMQIYNGADVNPFIPKAIDACKTALQIDPEFADAFNGLSQTYRYAGEYELSKGVDPRKNLALSAQHAENAIRIDPKNGTAFGKLGTAYSLLAEYESNFNRDPSGQFQKANEAFLQAIEINSRDSYAFHNLAVNQTALGRYFSHQGLDDEPYIKKAIEYELKTLEINPKHAFAMITLGNAYSMLGNLEAIKGEDPRKSYDESVSWLGKALSERPKMSFAMNNSGSVLHEKAVYEMDNGIDPKESLERAKVFLDQSLNISPDNAFACFNLGKIYRTFAKNEIAQNRNPERFIRLSAETLERGIKINPTVPGPNDELGTTLLLQARYEMDNGKDPMKKIEEARKWIQRSFELAADRGPVHSAKGDATLLEAEWRLQNTQDSLALIHEAIVSYQKSAELRKDNRDAMFGLARAYALLAELQTGEDRAESIAKGTQALESILARTPKSISALKIKTKLQ